MNSFFRNLLRLMICVSLLSLLACSNEDFSDLERDIKQIKSRPKGAIEPLPENKTIEPFLFNLDGSRDPFKPVELPSDETDGELENEGNNKGIQPDFTRRKEDLEEYPLDTLEMVGTVKKGDILWGLVRSKDGIQKVKKGNYMGMNHGRIVQITEKQIDLIEIMKDKKPKVWYEQSTSLPLKVAGEE